MIINLRKKLSAFSNENADITLSNKKSKFKNLSKSAIFEANAIQDKIKLLTIKNKSKLLEEIPTLRAKMYNKKGLQLLSAVLSSVGIILELKLKVFNTLINADKIVAVCVVVLFYQLGKHAYTHLENLIVVKKFDYDLRLKILEYIPSLIYISSSIYTNYLTFNVMLKNEFISVLFGCLIDLFIVRNCINKTRFEMLDGYELPFEQPTIEEHQKKAIGFTPKQNYDTVVAKVKTMQPGKVLDYKEFGLNSAEFNRITDKINKETDLIKESNTRFKYEKS